MSQKVTGKAGSFKYNNQVLSFQKITLDVDRELADTTDSDDYNAQLDIIQPSQIPVKATTKLNVEGRFNLSTTNVSLIVPLYSGANAVPTSIGINGTVQAGHGNFDVSNFSMEEPVDDAITWKATLTSNGPFTPGS